MSAATLDTSAVSTALARDRLGPTSVTMNVMAAIATAVVVIGIIPLGIQITGATGLPAIMAATVIVLLVWSVGYTAIAQHVPNAGTFYAYISAGLGKAPGVGAAWIQIFFYNAFQVGTYGALGPAAATLLEQWFGVHIFWWVLSAGACMLVGILGMLEVTIPARVMMVLAIIEVALVIFYNIAIITTTGFHPSTAALAPSNLWAPGAGTAFALSFTSVIGFEHTANYSEEAAKPRRTIWLAIVIGLIAMLVIYGGSSWIQISALTPAVAGPDLFLNEAAARLGEAARTGGLALLVSSLFAGALAFHNVFARSVHSPARDRVLPHILASTSLKGVPWVASLVQSVIGMAVILTWGLNNWDPQTTLFYWFGTAGGVGIMTLITVTSLAVIAFFARNTLGESHWRRWIAPGLSLVASSLVAYLVFKNLPLMFGVDGWTGPAVAMPIVLVALGLTGASWALILKFWKPEIYAKIGTGARTAPRPAMRPAFAGELGVTR